MEFSRKTLVGSSFRFVRIALKGIVFHLARKGLIFQENFRNSTSNFHTENAK